MILFLCRNKTYSALIQITNSVITTLKVALIKPLNWRVVGCWIKLQLRKLIIFFHLMVTDWAWIIAPTVSACSIAQLNWPIINFMCCSCLVHCEKAPVIFITTASITSITRLPQRARRTTDRVHFRAGLTKRHLTQVETSFIFNYEGVLIKMEGTVLSITLINWVHWRWNKQLVREAMGILQKHELITKKTRCKRESSQKQNKYNTHTSKLN